VKLGLLQKAQEAYQKSVHLYPQRSESYYHLGLLHLQENRLQEAEPLIRQALRLKPDSMEYRETLEKLKET